MKVLLSAYACEPGKGSEPGVGWHWALEIARLGHEVWVLTRAQNRSAIEAALARRPRASNPRFRYYELPAWAGWWQKGRRGIRLYNFLWQWGAYGVAQKLHAQERFDMVHHITWGVVRQPSFMGKLGIPFVFGPVGGGEKAPWRLRKGYPVRGWVWDALRDVANLAIKVDPFMRDTYRRATHILAKTSQSRGVIPRRFRAKTRVRLEIGVDVPAFDDGDKNSRNKRSGPFRVLYVGNFLYLKGIHLGLEAFARLVATHPDARLTLVGSGPDEDWLRRRAKTFGIETSVAWVSWIERDRLWDYYRSHHALLFPSLHDSSGNVVLEALARGLPVISLDLGGPGEIVDETCGRVVSTRGQGRDAVVNGLAHALIELAEDPAARTRLASGALKRARQFDWRTVVRRVYSEIAAYRP